MRVALLQFDMDWEDKARNFAKIRRYAENLERTAGPELIILPEMCATGFTMASTQHAESQDGPTARFLAELARDRKSFVLGGAIGAGGTTSGASHGEPKPSNVAWLFGPDGTLRAEYAKIHPFSFAGEDARFSAGSALVVVDLPETGLRLGLAICYDLRFPELFRGLVDRGANAFAVIANWPQRRIEHWRALLLARAIENQAFVFGVNRIGAGGGLDYNGQSSIISPEGRLLADGHGNDGWVSASVEAAAAETWRSAFPALRDRRLGSISGVRA